MENTTTTNSNLNSSTKMKKTTTTNRNLNNSSSPPCPRQSSRRANAANTAPRGPRDGPRRSPRRANAPSPSAVELVKSGKRQLLNVESTRKRGVVKIDECVDATDECVDATAEAQKNLKDEKTMKLLQTLLKSGKNWTKCRSFTGPDSCGSSTGPECGSSTGPECGGSSTGGRDLEASSITGGRDSEEKSLGSSSTRTSKKGEEKVELRKSALKKERSSNKKVVSSSLISNNNINSSIGDKRVRWQKPLTKTLKTRNGAVIL